MSTKTNDSTPKPFVSDERIAHDLAISFADDRDRHAATIAACDVRDLYEPHVQQLVRERDEAVAKVKLSQWIFSNLEEVIIAFRGRTFVDGIGEVAFKEKESVAFDVTWEPEGRHSLIYVRYDTLKRKFISASGFGVSVSLTTPNTPPSNG